MAYQNSSAILLHTIQYTDSQKILHLYTEKWGRTSAIFSIKNNKKSQKALLSPLALLNITLYKKPNKSIFRTTENTIETPYKTIYSNPEKLSIAFFLSEFLLNVIKEEEPNKTLFDFLYSKLLIFDSLTKNFIDFHLFFLAQLTHHVGIYPNYSAINETLLSNSNISFELLNSFFDNNNYSNFSSGLNQNTRQMLLKNLINYYNFHLNISLSLKTLDVLSTVYA